MQLLVPVHRGVGAVAASEHATSPVASSAPSPSGRAVPSISPASTAASPGESAVNRTGQSYAQAASTVVALLAAARELGASGIALKDEGPALSS